MADSYTKIYLQIVFSPFGRENTIPMKHKEELHKYATGIIQKRGHKLLAINSMKDHIHILIGYNPSQLLPDLIRDIKANTSKFINEKNWIPGKFKWQEGYGCFSYSYRESDSMIKYVMNQELHHSKQSFREEYFTFLNEYNVEYNPEYLFEYYDN
ncbi:MAG TPA: IS200/IS605 family transposase [Bacteroidales bacterium]|nr:IS200/IS605 family transposase [Bacteroidales bacterium]